MKQIQAEQRIKGLQKGFLTRIEQHPVFKQLDPSEFNDLRRRVFRGTFAAYRLGVVGIETAARDDHAVSLSEYFFCWLTRADAFVGIEPQVRAEVADLCLYVALEAYRIGAMVAFERVQGA